MKKCEKCNKQHDGSFGSGRYCSRQCANSRNHSKQTREKISLGVNLHINGLQKKYKQSTNIKPVKKQKFCISCQQQMFNKSIYCKQCNKYSKNIELFSKLNINQKNLIVAAKQAIQLLLQQYYGKKQSLAQMFQKYNIRYNTIYNFFKKMGYSLRNNSLAGINAYVLGRAKHRAVHTKYKTKHHTTWQNKNVFLRSSYQIQIAQFLDQIMAKYDVQKLRLVYTDKNGTQHVYITDFYLQQYNLVIETKSDYYIKGDQNLIYKIQCVKNNGYNFLLLNDKWF